MHPFQRTGLTALTLGAVGAAFVAGVSFGRSTGPAATAADRTPSGGQPVRLVNADLRPAASCDALLRWYVERGMQRVTAYGWDYPRIYEVSDAGGTVPVPGSVSGDVPVTPQPSEATSSDTGTNVQESGVDEPDVVKTDGRLVVRVLDDSSLVLYDVSGTEPVRLGSFPLAGVQSPELLLAGDRVVVIGREAPTPDFGTTTGTRVLVLDVADPSAPTAVRDTTYGSTLVTARQTGDVVRLVLSMALPDLDFVEPGLLRGEQRALERNQDVVRASTIDDWLPQVTTTTGSDTSTAPLLDCDQVAVPTAEAGLGTVAIVGFDVADPGAVDATAVTTPSETVYMSADHLYLASAAYRGGWEACCWDVPAPSTTYAGDDGTTYLYDFALAGTAATYAASGRVDGSVADRWSMDEHDGVLRVAVGPTVRTGDFNSVVTFSQQGTDLVEVGRVDRLGEGEQIRSMRWFDGLAVMVTFRQTDPFYAIDLTDPAAPRLLGALKIPGFSSYLHPIGGDKMIGIGSAADPTTGIPSGAKASLFDVSELTAPRELDTVAYSPGTTPQAAVDPRQFTWLPDRRTALTVVSSGDYGQTGYVSVLRVADDGTMTNRMVEVEYGVEVGAVRLVPLPDGRVVLVTGDAVSFFAL